VGEFLVEGPALCGLEKYIRAKSHPFQIPLAKSYLGDRAVYRQSSLYGTTVHEMGAKAEVSVHEIRSLAEEILGLLGHTRHARRGQ
jgi:hypothetical protein